MDTDPKLRYTKESNFLFTVNWGEKKRELLFMLFSLLLLLLLSLMLLLARSRKGERPILLHLHNYIADQCVVSSGVEIEMNKTNRLI